MEIEMPFNATGSSSSREMSFSTSSSIACFDNTIEFVEWLYKYGNSARSHFTLPHLNVGVRIMKTLFLCARNRRSNHFSYLECGCQESNCESFACNISFRIQELVFRKSQELQSAYLTSGSDGVEDKVSRFLDNIIFFWIDTGEKLRLILLDEHRLVGVPNVGRLMDLVDSFLDILVYILHSRWLLEKDELDILEALKEKLMFLKIFISFVTTPGVEHLQLIELLIAVELVAVKAARLIFIFWFSRYEFLVDFRLYLSEISQLLQKFFKPLDPQVRETCIHALTALKLSRSSPDTTLALGRNWQIQAAEFLDLLLGNLWDLLHYDTTGFIISVKDQMQKLYEGVTLLRYLLREHQEKFNGLHDKMKDFIRIVVYDAGIVICSLSPNEMTEGLAKETNNALFHLLEVLKFTMVEVSQFIHHLVFLGPMSWARLVSS